MTTRRQQKVCLLFFVASGRSPCPSLSLSLSLSLSWSFPCHGLVCHSRFGSVVSSRCPVAPAMASHDQIEDFTPSQWLRLPCRSRSRIRPPPRLVPRRPTLCQLSRRAGLLIPSFRCRGVKMLGSAFAFLVAFAHASACSLLVARRSRFGSFLLPLLMAVRPRLDDPAALTALLDQLGAPAAVRSALSSLAFALADPSDPAQVKLFLKSLLGLPDDDDSGFVSRPLGRTRPLGVGPESVRTRGRRLLCSSSSAGSFLLRSCPPGHFDCGRSFSPFARYLGRFCQVAARRLRSP